MENRQMWQPIETAPKDGSYILAYDSESESIDVVFWHDGAEGLGGKRKVMEWCVKDSYGDEQGGWFDSRATHWMPLPEPPIERSM